MHKNGKQFTCIVCDALYYVPAYRFDVTNACSEYCQKQLRMAHIQRKLGLKAEQLYREGYSLRQVAHACSINQRTVRKILEARGIAIRSRVEAISQAWRNGRPKNREVRSNHRFVRERGACENCGSTENLEIHHVDGKGSSLPYELRNEAIENLRLLCRFCHKEAERQRGGGVFAPKARVRLPRQET